MIECDEFSGPSLCTAMRAAAEAYSASACDVGKFALRL